MSEVAIRIDHLGKRYRLGRRERYRTVRESLGDLVRFPRRRAASPASGTGTPPIGAEAENGFIWALKDVSLDIRRGEVLGIIGRNGAGKTTLLKITSRVTEPTEGCVEILGRVGSLLEVGTGFHPELTGRENIYLNGAILGMRKAEIERKFDEIVAFAECERFLDTPVKRYSSGMYVRLAFAVAAHLEPEILLVDEVLAVGDAGFQAKCLGRIRELRDQGNTILLVSHNMASVLSFSSRVVWFEGGRPLRDGAPEAVVQGYLASLRSSVLGRTVSLEHASRRHGEGAVRMTGVRVYERDSPESAVIRSGQDMNVEIAYRSRDHRKIEDLVVGITVENQVQQRLAFCQNAITGREFALAPPEGILVCTLRRLPLTPGQYSLSLGLWANGGAADGIYQAVDFEVTGGMFYPTGALPMASYGNLLLDYDWTWRPLGEPSGSGDGESNSDG